MRGVVALVAMLGSASAHAQAATPFEAEVRRHYYARLARSPARAFAWELLLPGAGSVYTGVYGAAAASLALSVAGAAMWIAGARRGHDGLLWAGVGTFAAGRTHGAISAPVSALLLNAAFRRQLGVSADF